MFTCNTCSLQFPTAEDQRSHMKGDWHRYNLKRRVAQLPAISEELFQSKVVNLTEDESQNKKEKQVTKKEQRRREKEAILEKKRQILQIAKAAVLERVQNGEIPEGVSESVSGRETEPEPKEELKQEESQKEEPQTEEPQTEEHQTENPQAKEITVPELTQEQQEEKLLAEKLATRLIIKPTTCLFSHPKYNHNFTTIEENIQHMFKQHGLYIPEQKYLIDPEGLLEYLGEKIGFGFCIVCNFQGRSAEAAREHMMQKRHMRIPYETEDEKLEISKFYDFSSTYDDVTQEEGAKADEADGADEDWEDVSDEGEDEGEEDDLPPVEQDALYQHGHELILPSGTVIGHRSMMRYYRQNLAPERILSEGQGTVIAAETRHMLSAKDRQELATKKRVWAKEKKRDDVNDRRAAKFINNQPHYRDQLLQ